MWGNIVGAGIGALGSIAGGLLGNASNSAANSANNSAAAALNAQNIAYQKEFAQNGIRWKVDDAKEAGLHPLAALGASTNSFTPVTASASRAPQDYSFLSDVGQQMGQAFTTKKTDVEKTLEAYKLAEARLSLEAKGAEISHLNALTTKALRDSRQMPSIPAVMPYSSNYKGQKSSKIPNTHKWVKGRDGELIQTPDGNVIEEPSWWFSLTDGLDDMLAAANRHLDFGQKNNKSKSFKFNQTR